MHSFKALQTLLANDGADGLLRHLGSDLSNALDVHIVDDLRNFLFGPSSGMDLAAINIQRGSRSWARHLERDTACAGLEALPHIRASELRSGCRFFTEEGLWRYQSTGTYGSAVLPKSIYAAPWLAKHLPTIIGQQFEALRDGDRLWYLNQGFDQRTVEEIESTTLSSLILANTNTAYMQPDAFILLRKTCR